MTKIILAVTFQILDKMAPIDIWYIWPQKQKELICHQLAIVTGVVWIYPLTKISLRQMLSGQSAKKVTFYTVHEGLFLMYRGVLPQIIQRCSSITATYIVHQNINMTFQEYPKTRAKFYAGSLLGTLDSFLMPFERVQVILADKRYNQTYRNTWHCFNSLVIQHGLKELYRGFDVVYLRNILGSIIFLSLLLEKEKLLNQEKRKSGPAVILSASRVVFDSLQGTLVSTIMHPLNVLRVFLHSQVGERHTHFHIALKQVYREKGVYFFFNGLYINMVRSWASWVIIAFSNELYRQTYFHFIKPRIKK